MKTRRKNLKLERRIEVGRRFAKGESAKTLSAAFGISTRQVNRIANEQRGEGLSVRDPSETVAFRASQSELAAFDAEWRERGFRNRSQALNAVLRGRCGFLDVGQGELADFSAAWRQAKDVSDDVRTLAKSVVLGKLTVSAKDRALLRVVGDLTSRLSREMGRMKDAARARHGHGFTTVIEEPSDA
ncbi:MAG: hypothetical protein JKY94_03675 [Rhodobacteraceae bacterium]|nr:hypothetical protein [Paracoccaceae bacterium]